MKTSVFAKIPECHAPINKLAKIGISYIQRSDWTSWECPPLYPGNIIDVLNREHKEGKVKCVEDVTGWKYGKLTVIGFMYKRKTPKSRGFNRDMLFAVRCDCGRYEVRTMYSILRNARNGFHDSCEYCTPQEIKDRRTY
jgi:hypothetical protein